MAVRTNEDFFANFVPEGHLWTLAWKSGHAPHDIVEWIYEGVVRNRTDDPWLVRLRDPESDAVSEVLLASLIGGGSNATGNEGVCLTEADALAYLRDRQEACFNDPRTRAFPQPETRAPAPTALENA